MAQISPRSSDLPVISAGNTCLFEFLSVQHALLNAQFQPALRPEEGFLAFLLWGRNTLYP